MGVGTTGKVSYKSPVPRVELPNRSKVDKYLARQRKEGKLMGITGNLFNFDRVELVRQENVVDVMEVEWVEEVEEMEVEEDHKPNKLEVMVKRLTLDPDIKLDHGRECDKASF